MMRYQVKALKFSIVMLLCLNTYCQINTEIYVDTSSIMTSNGNYTAPSNVYSTTIAESGEIGYFCVKEQTGQYRIKKYDITGAQPILMGYYQNSNSSTQITNLALYKGYIFAHKKDSDILSVFNESTYAFLGQTDTNTQFNILYSAQKKNLILFVDSYKNVGYIKEEHMPLPSSSQVYQFSGISTSGWTRLAISYEGDYAGVCSQGGAWLQILNLNTLTVHQNLTFPTTNRADTKSICWDQTKNTISALGRADSTVYQYDISANTSETNISYFSYTVSHSNQIVRVRCQSENQRYFGMGKNAGTNKWTLYELYFDSSGQPVYTDVDMLGVSQVDIFLEQQLGVVSMTQNNYPYIYGVKKCHVNYFENTCTNECVECTADCSECSELGCGVDPQNCPGSQSDSEEQVESEQESVVVEQESRFTQGLIEDMDRTNAMVDLILGNSLLQVLNYVPMSRSLFHVVFGFFCNFDDLWLYNYHNRSYSPVVENLFAQIQQLEDKKWELIRAMELWDFIGINLQPLQDAVNLKESYSSQRFVSIQGHSNGFFINIVDFVFSNILFTLATFGLLKLVFHCLQNYRISILFREYYFSIKFLLVLVNGNLQYFSYLVSFEFHTLFAKIWYHKILSVLVILVFLMVILMCVGLFFYTKERYKELNKYFMENTHNNLKGLIVTIFYFTLRNIALGLVHYMLEYDYQLKIILILVIEMIFFIIGIDLVKTISQSNKHYSSSVVFLSKTKVWLGIIFTSVLRMMLVVTFYLTGSIVKEDCIEYQLILYAQNFLIQGHLVLFITYMLYSIFEVFLDLLKFLEKWKSEIKQKEEPKYKLKFYRSKLQKSIKKKGKNQITFASKTKRQTKQEQFAKELQVEIVFGQNHIPVTQRQKVKSQIEKSSFCSLKRPKNIRNFKKPKTDDKFSLKKEKRQSELVDQIEINNCISFGKRNVK